MTMKRLLFAPIAVMMASSAQAELRVVGSTEDMAALAREVGGDKVKVDAIGRGYQDPHFVEAKPSFILVLAKADLLIAVGRELEISWLPPLVTQSRNAKIQPGSPGYLDASQNVRILDIPTGALTRAMGDVHPSGNPHYWLDPNNGRLVAQAIKAKLQELDRANAAYYDQRYADFDRRLAEAEKRWDATMAPFKGMKIVTYHRSWTNFADRFKLDVIGFVEPKPGVPPSPQHTIDLIKAMKAQGIKVLLVEPYFDLKTPNSIGRETGAAVLVMPPSVGGEKVITDYIKLFDYDVDLFAKAAGGH
jgi:zinc/manganese transport system substrate-binding protein